MQWSRGREAWEGLLEMDSTIFYVEEMDQGAVSFVVDLAKAFEKVQFKVAWVWRCTSAFRDTFCVSSLGLLQQQRRALSPRSFQARNGLYCFFF